MESPPVLYCKDGGKATQNLRQGQEPPPQVPHSLAILRAVPLGSLKPRSSVPELWQDKEHLDWSGPDSCSLHITYPPNQSLGSNPAPDALTRDTPGLDCPALTFLC